MTTTVPAHGEPATAYSEVDSRQAYDAAVARQARAAPPQPSPAPPPKLEAPDAAALDMAAEVDYELAVDDQLADPPDPTYPDGAVAVPLVGAEGRRGVVHVLDVDDWPSDANSALQIGDLESWAEACLAGDDYDDVWADLCPTVGQVKKMFEEYRALTGTDTGKSLASPRSLRRAARRSRQT